MPWLVLKSLYSIVQNYERILVPCLRICLEDLTEIPILAESELVDTAAGAIAMTSSTAYHEGHVDCWINDGHIGIPSKLEDAIHSAKTELENDSHPIKIFSICEESHNDQKWHCFTADRLDLLEVAPNSLAKVHLPSYSAYNCFIYSQDAPIETANILFFPLIPGPAGSYSATYTAFKLGELHIVFVHVRAIGCFLENTGIDD